MIYKISKKSNNISKKNKKIHLIFFLLFCNIFVLLSPKVHAQIIDTVSICNGDSILIFNNWETQTGNYTDGFNITTLIVNPSPILTGNFILNGNATQQTTNTYNLTQAIGNQSGSAWNSVTLNLTQPFIFNVDMFFGYNNYGADGMAFLLQQVNTSVGTAGGGIGYEGITPSFAVEFDTYQNSNRADPTYDHLSIQKNGDLNHSGINNLVPFMGFPPNNINIEDGVWHNVIFSWDPITFNFKVTFDGVLMINYFNDIVANIFGNNPNVYWGFTAATGGANNLQQFRVNSLNVQLSDVTICNPDTIQIDPQINTGAYSYLWTPNYNILNNTNFSPFFFPDSTTLYSLEITNLYGCSFVDSMTIFVNTPTSNTNNISVCDSYDWSINGTTYDTSGIYINISTNASGCIHIDSLNLIINNSSYTSDEVTTCDSYTWLINDTTYYTSGTYVNTNTNSSGCVHTDSLYLTINNSSIINIIDTACGEFLWQGSIYDNSGSYTNILTDNNGCDSILNLQLTIFETNSIEYISACDSAIWNNVWYYNDTTVVDTFLTINSFGGSAGCDSIATAVISITNSNDLYLIINENHVSCFGGDNGNATINTFGGLDPYTYLWSDGQITNPVVGLSAGNYSFTVTDANGCHLDSSLIINEPNELFLDFIATSPICKYDTSILSINISNSILNTYTILLQDDTIMKSFVIDTNGLLIPEGIPIKLIPETSREVYIISLTNNEGCTQEFNDNVHIEIKQLPELAINQEDLCKGSPSFTLSNATPIGGSYSINDISTNLFDIENLDVGEYNIGYSYTDPLTLCYNEIVEVVNLNESPIAEMLISPQPTNIENPNILFRDNSNTDFLNSEWHLGDGSIIYNEANFWHTYNDTGIYTIKYYITNANNCTDSIINNLIIHPIYSVFIPNAFSPNNDGKNDFFMPTTIGASSFNIMIFDRWGKLIYENNKKWNGKVNSKMLPNGSYAYSITVYNFVNKPFIYTGFVNLVR